MIVLSLAQDAAVRAGRLTREKALELADKPSLDQIDKGINAYRFRFPSVMYHVTEAKNIESILKNGILVNQQRSSKKGQIFGVYLAEDPDDLTHSDDFSFSKPVALKVSTGGLTLRLDPEFYNEPRYDAASYKAYVDDCQEGSNYWAAYSKSSIPAKNVKR